MEISGSSSTSQTLADSIRADLNNTTVESLTRYCIYRVPKLLREANENAYTPIVVSIGPYHYKDERLRSMESYKLKYLKSFLTGVGHQENGHELLNLCAETIKGKETEIRESYADPIDLSSDEFTRMVLVDSVFIIEFLWRHCYPGQYEHHDKLFPQVRIKEIVRDMLLLENQLPFFIIKELYGIAYQRRCIISGCSPYFTKIVCKFLNLFREDEITNDEEAECHHLLDLVRSYYVPSDVVRSRFTWAVEGISVRDMVCRTATHLDGFGVGFGVVEIDGDCRSRLLCIHFNNTNEIQTMAIPKLKTEDPTLSLFRNMVAFEQCNYLFDAPTYITDYFYLLHCLMKTPQDVELLAAAGIVENWLGNEVLCDMFNTISSNTIISWRNYAYAGLMEQINRHCKRRWNYHRFTLKNTYFRSPWAAISVLNAVTILVLTMIQAMTAIWSS